MVEAKLRVECLEARANNNPFYGNTLVKKVVEETLMHDFDNREDVAPYGIIATIDRGDITLDIRINKYYFDYDDTEQYVAYFQVDENVYEVLVKFAGTEIDSITLSVWLDNNDFLDGDDANKVYSKNDFTNIDILL